MTNFYRTRVAAMVIQLAKEDPELVLEMIRELKQEGEIEADDLVYLEEMARKWIRIAEANRRKGQS